MSDRQIDGLLYADRDEKTQAYEHVNTVELSARFNDVTGQLEIWGDHPKEEKVHMNLRLNPVDAVRLATDMIQELLKHSAL